MKTWNKLFLIGLALVAIAGCTGTRTAYSSAETIDEYAFVITEHYAALVNQAANLAQSPSTTPTTRQTLRDAEAEVNAAIVGTPEAPGLVPLAREYKAAEGDPSKLQAAIDRAIVRLAEFVRTIKGVKP